jgi:hypothetical protein
MELMHFSIMCKKWLVYVFARRASRISWISLHCDFLGEAWENFQKRRSLFRKPAIYRAQRPSGSNLIVLPRIVYAPSFWSMAMGLKGRSGQPFSAFLPLASLEWHLFASGDFSSLCSDRWLSGSAWATQTWAWIGLKAFCVDLFKQNMGSALGLGLVPYWVDWLPEFRCAAGEQSKERLNLVFQRMGDRPWTHNSVLC